VGSKQPCQSSGRLVSDLTHATLDGATGCSEVNNHTFRSSIHSVCHGNCTRKLIGRRLPALGLMRPRDTCCRDTLWPRLFKLSDGKRIARDAEAFGQWYFGAESCQGFGLLHGTKSRFLDLVIRLLCSYSELDEAKSSCCRELRTKESYDQIQKSGFLCRAKDRNLDTLHQNTTDRKPQHLSRYVSLRKFE